MMRILLNSDKGLFECDNEINRNLFIDQLPDEKCFDILNNDCKRQISIVLSNSELFGSGEFLWNEVKASEEIKN